MERLRMKNLLLACTVMLGLQFCFPVILRAGATTPVAELINLGAKDAESDADASADIELAVQIFFTLTVRQQSDAPQGLRSEHAGRVGLALLPVSGLFPSAP